VRERGRVAGGIGGGGRGAGGWGRGGAGRGGEDFGERGGRVHGWPIANDLAPFSVLIIPDARLTVEHIS
jgi:hypothetical protein